MKDLEYLAGICTSVECYSLNGAWDWCVTATYQGIRHTDGGIGCKLKDAAAAVRQRIDAIRDSEVRHAA